MCAAGSHEDDLNFARTITVGIPVYNAMPYLQETLENLLRQTWPHFEILAIVDGGSDQSLAYLESIHDSRLRILTQENQGVTATLNRMLRECNTPWLVRQDADDISHPTRMERIVESIHRVPQAGMFYSLANYHPKGRAVGSFRCSRGSPHTLRKIVRSGYLLAICHSTAVLNVAKTLALGGYRVGLHNEDADLWWRMALHHDIHCIPEKLVGFRQTPASVSALHLADQFVAGLYVQYLLLSHLWERTPQPISQIRHALEEFVPEKEFLAKQMLRSFNMNLVSRDYLSALSSFSHALKASPTYILRRLYDDFFASRSIRNGIQPRLYLERKEALWS
jgi:glycosyltransferase involved in cell wall biosynthesis